MKRDLDLATKILVKLEEKGINEDVSEVEGYSLDDFFYNARLLAGAGLIEIIEMGDTEDRYACVASQLTWAGHDFLDKARSPEWIAHLKEQGADIGKDVAVAGIKAALVRLGEALTPFLSNLF